MRRLIAIIGLLGAVLLLLVPAATACPGSRDAPPDADCQETDPSRGVPTVPLPVIDPEPAPVDDPSGRDLAPVPGPAPSAPAGEPGPAPLVSPAAQDGTVTQPGGIVGTLEGEELPFTGPRTATLVVLAGVLATIGAGSVLAGRYTAQH